jgi:hypothetical protein
MTLSDPTGNLLVIAIDGAEVDSEVDKSHVRALRGGNYIWLAKASSDRVVKNATDKEVRIVTFNLKG